MTMRVISLVPSLTETLAECGVNLVARTRFCVHGPGVSSLPVVGGTKDLSWDSVRSLRPDLLVLDREENLPWMKDDAPCAVFVFHASSIGAMPAELRRLAGVLGAGHAAGVSSESEVEFVGDSSSESEVISAVGTESEQDLNDAQSFQSEHRSAVQDESNLDPKSATTMNAYSAVAISVKLRALADRYQKAFDAPVGVWDFSRIPGMMSSVSTSDVPFVGLEYVIWKKPWMKMGPGTYIYSVLEKLGAGSFLPVAGDKYPVFEMDDLASGTFLLFSSEPFPFALKADELRLILDSSGVVRPSAIVDGEAYSWFGVRGLRFLEQALGLRAG